MAEARVLLIFSVMSKWGLVNVLSHKANLVLFKLRVSETASKPNVKATIKQNRYCYRVKNPTIDKCIVIRKFPLMDSHSSRNIIQNWIMIVCFDQICFVRVFSGRISSKSALYHTKSRNISWISWQVQIDSLESTEPNALKASIIHDVTPINSLFRWPYSAFTLPA